MIDLKPTLLIVDDEKNQREGLRAALEDDYDIYLADSVPSAIELIEKEHFDVLLTDFRMPNEDGLKLIIRAKSLPKPPICILMTAYGSEDIAVEAIKRGADDYISKGKLNIDELQFRINKALKQQKLEKENVTLKQQLDNKYGIENVVGQSRIMQSIFDLVQQVAPSQTTVLITGESGTGKELIARAIHQLSPRARQPLVTIHCAGLPATLLESELFGYEKGAFTGATERRMGRVEQAQGGTLFLDEIGEIDPTVQIKLLRFLGERTFERLGSNKTMVANVRLVAATNKDLLQLVRQGDFREDLYYRLNVVPIHMPPLRERRDDVPLLANAFLQEFARENKKPVNEFEPAAVEAMIHYSWPGNVRELRAAIEHAVVLSRSSAIALRDLPLTLRGVHAVSYPQGGGRTGSPTAAQSIEEAERQVIIQALQDTKGSRTEAARKLEMSRRTLHRKIKNYGLEGY